MRKKDLMSRFCYPFAGIATWLVIAGWALCRFSPLTAAAFSAPPVLLTGVYLFSIRSSPSNISLSAGYIGALLGCLLLPLQDLFRPFYASAAWFGPIAIGFALLMWPAVICIAGVTGMGIGYFFPELAMKHKISNRAMHLTPMPSAHRLRSRLGCQKQVGAGVIGDVSEVI